MDPKLNRPEICVSNSGILVAVSGCDLVRIDVVKGEELSRIPITLEDGSLLDATDPVDVKVLSTTHA